MIGQFSPMSQQALDLAKAYRDERIRAAEQSHLAASFRTPRAASSTRVWRTGSTMVAHLHHRLIPVEQQFGPGTHAG
jgi:hypothetical protein